MSRLTDALDDDARFGVLDENAVARRLTPETEPVTMMPVGNQGHGFGIITDLPTCSVTITAGVSG